MKRATLREYERKRDFTKTAEPRGARQRKSTRLQFVVQKHAASHLHYDFRLEINGALASWAIPKGPSLDPSEKRLAVQVEDHPLDYADFEGTIPAGEYGGGTVMVWDTGYWEPQSDAAAGLSAGKLKLTLAGKKLRGGFMLVRLARDRGKSTKPQWLLIKERDEFATDDDVLTRQPNSAKTRRTVDEIARGAKPRRRAIKTASAKRPTKKRAPRKANTGKTSARSRRKTTDDETASPWQSLAGVKRAPLRVPRQPQLATLVTAPPRGEAWLHELKFDGYRMLCRIEGGRARLISRRGQDWTDRMLPVAEAAALLPVDEAVLDGEVVVLDEHGVSHFQLLQQTLGLAGKRERLIYYVFDLLHLNGWSLVDASTLDRKRMLQTIVPANEKSPGLIRLSEHLLGDGDEFHQQACSAGLEGIISKRVAAPYQVGRTADWVKVKCRQAQEMVVGGFTRPEGSRVGFGALLVGHYTPDGKLHYAGRVGTGFDTQLLRELHRRLLKLEQKRSPFADWAGRRSAHGVRWVRPELVAQIKFNNWTEDGLLRQAAFEGLREDKPAREVKREAPRAVSKV
ncbi:MAG: non-homologous end-joining DNA ligase [Planctomycetaceae bacterium]|nr:non-homologous end-joining DNA ligase [Planctomycetaceae bacterium]